MKPIRVELRTSTLQYSSDPHQHPFFELSFLISGTRDIFNYNKIFSAPAKSFVIFSPFVLHHTSGGPFSRILVLLYKSALTQSEILFLDTYAKKGPLFFEEQYADLCFDLLKKAVEIENLKLSEEEKEEYTRALIKSLLFYMQQQHLRSTDHNAPLNNDIPSNPLVLKLVGFLNENYASNITLDSLQEKFFVSKTTLCTNFKKIMNCTLIEYLTRLRITKAMDALIYHNKNVEEIAEACGFSSSNYFRLIFKKEVGISPLQYRKENRIMLPPPPTNFNKAKSK